MSPEFSAKLESKIEAFRAWIGERIFRKVRLVQYCGREMVGARDIDPSVVETQIKGGIMEGFGVEWAEHENRLFLCIWEPWNPPGSPPPWANVFAESDCET